MYILLHILLQKCDDVKDKRHEGGTDLGVLYRFIDIKQKF